MKLTCINCHGIGKIFKPFIDTINSIYRLIPENCNKCNGNGFIGLKEWFREIFKGKKGNK